MTPDLKYEPPPASPRRRRHIAARKLTGQKPALKMKEVWAIRIRLQLARKTRELALFNMAIDSKLRGCDLVRLAPFRISSAIWRKAESKFFLGRSGISKATGSI